MRQTQGSNWLDEAMREDRTREQRAADSLEEQLRARFWRAWEAAYAMVGLDPERTMGGPGDWGFTWFPDGLRPEWQGLDQWTLERNVEDELDYVTMFMCGDPRSPMAWIEHALKCDYEARWLCYARAHPEMRNLVPMSSGASPSADKIHYRAENGRTTDYSAAQRRARLIGYNNSPEGRAMMQIKNHYEAWRDKVPRNLKKPDSPALGERKRFAGRMAGQFPEVSYASIYNNIGTWWKDDLASGVIHSPYRFNESFNR